MLIWIGNHLRLRPGRLMVIYVIGYFLGRFWIEGLRIDNANAGGGLRLNQWVALVAMAASGGFLVVDWLRHRDDPEPALVMAAGSTGEADDPAAAALDDVPGPGEELEPDGPGGPGQAEEPADAAESTDVAEGASGPSRSRPSMTSTFPRMSDDLVLIERKDPGIAILTLNRPDRMNAWTGALSARYFERLDECEADDSVKVIVITGAGRGYCAGADMDNLAAAGKQQGPTPAATARWPPPSRATCGRPPRSPSRRSWRSTAPAPASAWCRR